MAFYSKFARYYDLIFPFKQPIFDFLKGYTNSDMSNILDVGCGTGHYTAAFSKAGFQATGVDLDNTMINYANEQYPETDFHAINMLDIESLNQQFDLIFCIGNTLAHLRTFELHQFIYAVYRCLSKNGLWIFQVRNWDYVLQRKDYVFPVLTANDNQIQFTRTYTDISENSLQFNTRLIDRELLVFEDRATMTPLTSADYLDIHQNHHFKFVEHFGDFRRTPFDPHFDSANIFAFQKI